MRRFGFLFFTHHVSLSAFDRKAYQQLQTSTTDKKKYITKQMSNRQSRGDTRKLRIVLSTWGSTGDIQPFLALSERLSKEGHKVRVCTSEIYRDRFTKHGVDFYPVGAPFDLDRLDQAMDAIVQIKDPLKSAILIATEGILYKADQWYEDCLKGMEGYDLAICHSADVPGQEAAIRNNLP